MQPTRPLFRAPQPPDLPSQRGCSYFPSQKRALSDVANDSASYLKKHRGTQMEPSATSGRDASSADAVNISSGELEYVRGNSEPIDPATPTQSSLQLPVFQPLGFAESTSLEPHRLTKPPSKSAGTATEDPVDRPESNVTLEPKSILSGTRQPPRASTPVKTSSSHVDPAPMPVSDSSSLRSAGSRTMAQKRQSSQASRDSEASNQATTIGKQQMEVILRNELSDSVFLYSDFFGDFLPYDSYCQERVQNRVRHQSLTFTGSQWSFDRSCFTTGNEDHMYGPLVELLNTIGKAAFSLLPATQKDHFRPEYQPFSDHHNKTTQSDYPSDGHTKPDLVKAKRAPVRGGKELHSAHWGDIELVVECKPSGDQGSQNQAFLQLARYARTTFSHQIYRLYVFGIAVCGPIVTFVRFDRSGLLLSPPLDLRLDADADQFVRRTISLLSLSPKKFGYDPQYMLRLNENKRYELVFTLNGSAPRTVHEMLCHRKCCCGRATIATCLSATLGHDLQDSKPVPDGHFLNREIVHKRIWRQNDRTSEGTTLNRFKAVFGVCQVIAYLDGQYTTEVQNPESLEYSPAASFFIPTKVSDGYATTSGSTIHTAASAVSGSNVSGQPGSRPEVPSLANNMEADDDAKRKSSRDDLSGRPGTTSRSQHLDQPGLRKSTPASSRVARVVSDLLMPKGSSLLQAQSSAHLLYAIHDAFIGIMAFAEAGMIHSDISVFNILLVDPNEHYASTGGNWKGSVTGSLGKEVWECSASALLPDIGRAEDVGKTIRLEYVESLRRGPFGVLCDVEYSANERRAWEEVHRDRTGTPAFMSAQLLRKPTPEQPRVARTFIHDIESLMWVLVWLAIHQPSTNMTEEARRFARNMAQHDLSSLADFKKKTICDSELERTIAEFGNSWAEELAPVIAEMARFFARFLYYQDPDQRKQSKSAQKPSSMDWEEMSSPSPFSKVPRITLPKATPEAARAEHETLTKFTRWDVFGHFTDLFKDQLKKLKERGISYGPSDL